jgi:hypothetical protein
MIAEILNAPVLAEPTRKRGRPKLPDEELSPDAKRMRAPAGGWGRGRHSGARPDGQ